jgi:hypothetical protein
MTIISNSMPSRIPRIPYEILVIIVRNATLVPQILDIPPYDYFTGDGILSNIEKIDAVERSYPTKLAITRVCRACREVGLHYLFEAFVIRSGKDMKV